MSRMFLTLKIVGAIVIVLSLLNPSYKRFNEFTSGIDVRFNDEADMVTKFHEIETVRRRTSNFIIFSIYEKGESNYLGEYIPKEKYLGFMLNFYKI